MEDNTKVKYVLTGANSLFCLLTPIELLPYLCCHGYTGGNCPFGCKTILKGDKNGMERKA